MPSTLPPRSFTTTLAPWRANDSACSRPMPRPAPVTMAMRPSQIPVMAEHLARITAPAAHANPRAIDCHGGHEVASDRRAGGRVATVGGMCEQHGPTSLTRRAALALGAAGAAALGRRLRTTFRGDLRAGRRPGHPAPRPRRLAPAAWGGDLLPRGPLEREDVRFLLVHHSATTNTYTPPRCRRRCATSTPSTPAPPRAGRTSATTSSSTASAASGKAARGASPEPVVASATGGSQGFAQLVCLLGDFTAELPTPRPCGR